MLIQESITEIRLC